MSGNGRSKLRGEMRLDGPTKSRNYLRQIKRRSRMEQLEPRMVMATGPVLVGIIPNTGDLLLDAQVRSEAPRELTFRFQQGIAIDPASVAAGIKITAGGDRILGNGNDQVIVPGYIGVNSAPNANEVVVRFASPLADDKYQIDIFGTGASALKDTNGNVYNTGGNTKVTFTLDLGAQVVAVVPQPVTRNSSNVLSQARNQIQVYFNVNDPLANTAASALNTAFYQLIFTNRTATNVDDVVYNPTGVAYDSTKGLATLTFANDLALLASGEGTYRLRIGNSDPLPLAPSVTAVTGEGTTLNTAYPVGALGNQTRVLQSAIEPIFYPLEYPGSPREPGHIDVTNAQNAPQVAQPPDFTNGITTLFYNFQKVLAFDSNNFPLLTNVITDIQKQRAREIFQIYSRYLGVQFVESTDKGITVATGDLAALGGISDPGGVAGLAGVGPTGNPLALMDNAETGTLWGNSEFGGAWFKVAMHEVGHLLGFGHNTQTPSLTIMATAVDNGQLTLNNAGNNVPAENVFPGDGDLINGQYLYRPDSNDINMYKFNVTTNGTVNLELASERLTNSSLLDGVISLFDHSGNLIARNDNYYGKDSFLELKLTPGEYYVGVTSTGNTAYDPTAPDTGLGGTTQGKYELRMTFKAEQTAGITDTTGTLLDGDGDGVPGGAYNFWFDVATSAHTIYVDKAPPTTPVGALGSITNPRTTISSAFTAAAATPGTVVRIVGNNFGNDSTNLTDNKAYEIGRNPNNVVLGDGEFMRVPKGVSVVIDAGAMFKLRHANIDVGSLSQGIDRSQGSLQVLGTPTIPVYFTSYENEAMGVDTFSLTTAPMGGNWGGIVFRNRLDFDENRTVREDQGIFLNYVNHADISYGGGQVVVSSNPVTFSPITMEEARPTISFNNLHDNASYALRADPNSFKDNRISDMTSPTGAALGRYEADYDRVGPDIQGNRIVGNSINALFVDISLEAGSDIEELTVPGRFNDNVVHVITDQLKIAGNPGGPTLDEATGEYRDRPGGRLVIDPGTVVKLNDGRIEVELRAQLIAEGRSSTVKLNNTNIEIVTPVVFTSLYDNRFGASGTFNTDGDHPTAVADKGDWAGFYFAPTSKGSFDHVLVTYAGGDSPIEGGSATFNTFEIYQADVRIANSTITENANGFAMANDRNGRGTNDRAVIFVRGAQPSIVHNILRNNDGAAISINVNALNSNLLADPGRSTGALDADTELLVNFGPYIRGNRFDARPTGTQPVADTQLNGMLVRGGVLTTAVVFDDTDITHVLESEITVPNFYSKGGLRILSRPTESLVVKLGPDPNNANNVGAITASGSGDNNPDRLGGSVDIVGQPGRPVVLTSLFDDTVGSGLTVAGNTETDTNNDGDYRTSTTARRPRAGDWRSILIDPYASDRNVALVLENEEIRAAVDVNGAPPNNAQDLGQLAPTTKDGDDVRRLGFQIQGTISTVNGPSLGGDADVYKFQALPGTEVWLDIDKTSPSLDTILELVDADGTVIASSNDSLAETKNPALLGGIAQVLQKDTTAQGDFYSTNVKDAGFRVTLPGNTSLNKSVAYFVRVRANSNDVTNVEGGLTKGSYELNIRLKELDEVPGSTVQYATISYATVGVDVRGKPSNSPLAAESGETSGNNDAVGGAQDLGARTSTSQGTLGVAGYLTNYTDVDWYRFTLAPGQLYPTIFDIEYASGLGRPDLRLSVFDANFNLVLTNDDANVADDRPRPHNGSDLTDLSRGSVGGFDPFIGTANLTAQTYYVAVSHFVAIPAELSASPLVRIEPINSIQRIVEDHIYISALDQIQNRSVPQLGNPAFGIGTATVEGHATPFHLGDVTMYINTLDDVYTIDPFTGALLYDLTGFDPLSLANIPLQDVLGRGYQYGDIYMTSGGQLLTESWGGLDGTLDLNAQSGNLRQISTADGSIVSSVDDEIITYAVDPNNPGGPARDKLNKIKHNAGVWFDALTQGPDPTANGIIRNIVVGHVPGNPAFVDATTNLLYVLHQDGTRLDIIGDSAPDDSRLPTDNVERARLTPGPTIIPQPATDIVPLTGAGQDNGFAIPGDLLDATRFSLTDASGDTLVFEMDSGPDYRLVPDGPEAVRDGDTFTMSDGVNPATFEFDSGPVLVIAGAPADGAFFTIQDTAGAAKTFEFDNNGAIVNGRVAVGFTNSDPLLTLASSAFNAIQGAGLLAKAVLPKGNAYVGRVSITGDTNMVAVGAGIALEGNYGPTIPGSTNVLIPFEETGTPAALGAAMKTAVQGALAPLRVGFAARSGSPVNSPYGTTGDRITFYGATAADFTNSPAFFLANAFGGAPSATGKLVTSNIVVPFSADDDEFDLAASIAQAVNSAHQIFPQFGVTATIAGSQVNFDGTLAAPISPDNPDVLSAQGEGPGGNVTGLALLNGTYYAVSDRGGLYTLSDPFTYSPASTTLELSRIKADPDPFFAPALHYIATATDLLGINLSGLSAGPPNAENGRYANMLFATAADGRLYAFNTLGELQPIFMDGATSIDTGIPDPHGLAFSTLDRNLWHVASGPRSLPNERSNDRGHGIMPTFDGSRPVLTDNGQYRTGGTSLYFGAGSYNFPGGAYGSITSDPFSLKNYTSQDQPKLYFNYFLDSETANNFDRAAVYISADGTNWTLLSNALTKNSGGWLQASFGIGGFAGEENLRLRFDFSTGGFGVGDNDWSGSFLHALAGDQLQDGDTFRIDNQVFEFDMGYSLTVPAAAGHNIVDGSTFTITSLGGLLRTFTFNKTGAPIPNSVNYSEFDSAAQLAQKIANAVTAAGIGVTPRVADARVNLTGALLVNVSPVLTAPAGSSIVDGSTFRLSDGVNTVTFEFDSGGGAGGNTPVPFTAADTAITVAQSMVTAINGAGLAVTAYRSGTSVVINGDTATFTPLTSVVAVNAAAQPALSGNAQLLLNNPAAFPVEIHATMTDVEVANAIAVAMDQVFTAGNSYLGGVTVNAVSGANIVDGDTFSVSDGNTTLTFEFDTGNGTGGGNIPLNFTAGDPAALVATNVAAAINTATLNAGMIIAAVPTGASVALVGPVVYFNPLTSMLTTTGNFDDPTLFTSVKQDQGGDRALLHVMTHVVNNEGPLTYSNALPGDAGFYVGNFTALPTATNPNPNPRGQDNAHEGFYIDDIMIGLAERGEMVTRPDGTQTRNTGFQFPGTIPPVTLSGPYDLEIRPSATYATAGTAMNPNPLFDTYSPLARNFDTNDRLTENGFIYSAPSGVDLHEGEIFRVREKTRIDANGNAINFITYEFDTDGVVSPGNWQIQFSRTDTDRDIAAKVRDAINYQYIVNQAAPVAAALETGNTITVYNAVALDRLAPDVNDRSLMREAIDNTRTNDMISRAVDTSLSTIAPGTFIRTGRIGDNSPREALKEIFATSGAGLTDTATFTINDGLTTYTFELNSVGGVGVNNIAVPFTAGSTAATVALNLVNAINTASQNQGLDVRAIIDPFAPSKVILLGHVITLNTTGSGLTSRDRPAGANKFTSLKQLEATAGTFLVDGTKFTLSDGITTRTFELNNTYLNNGVAAGNVAVPFTPLADANTVATSIATAINGTTLNIVAVPPAVGATVTLTGEIVIADSGSTPFTPTGDPHALDVDFLKVQLNVGERLEVNIDTNQQDPTSAVTALKLFYLDPVLGPVAQNLFDATDTLIFPDPTLSQAIAGPSESALTLDPYFRYTALATGMYFIAVSGSGNDSYNPLIPESGAEGAQGTYKISISVGRDASLNYKQFNEAGDSNTQRDQGYTLIQGNTITHSLQWGILSDDGAPDANGNLPHAGVVRYLRETNTQRTVPGIAIANNVLAFNGLDDAGTNAGFGGDLRFSGQLPTIIATPPAAPANNTTFTVTGGLGTVTFEFDLTNVGVTTNRQPVTSGTAAAIAAAINNSILGRQGVTATVSGGNILIDGATAVTGLGTAPNTLPLGLVPFGRIMNNTFYGVANPAQLGRLFQYIATPGNRIADAVTFVITAGGVNTTFEFDSNNSLTSAANKRIAFTAATTYAQMATAIANAIQAALPALAVSASGPNVLIGGATNITGAGQSISSFASSVTGARVDQNANPTLVNNVFANLSVGLSVDATSVNADPNLGTIVEESAYQNNVADTVGVGLGVNAFPANGSATVTPSYFVNAAAGNFYPAANAGIIDSSKNSIEDRANMKVVAQPLGISVSPILAPTYDLNGVFRDNDPSVSSPSGLGSNVYKDRGALDRADFVGPSVALLNPLDNDATGKDLDMTETSVQLVNTTLDQFSIQIVDGVAPADPANGTGVDDTTVTAASVTLTKDGVTLVAGVDYVFSYDSNNNTVRLVPAAGLWLAGSYVISFNNSAGAGIKDLAGNLLKANQITPQTRFTISVNQSLDYGDAPDPKYPSLLVNNGARHQLTGILYLGSNFNAEGDAQQNATATGDNFDDGVSFSTMTAGQTATITINASAAGKIDGWIDWNGNGSWTDAGDQVLVSLPVAAGANQFTITVPANSTSSTFGRFRLSTAGGLAPTGLAADGEVEDYKITVASQTPYKNPNDPCDIDNNGVVNNLDYFKLKAFLNTTGPHIAGSKPLSSGVVYPDASGNNQITNLDVLTVIHCLRVQNGVISPEGESIVAAPAALPQLAAGGEGEGDTGSVLLVGPAPVVAKSIFIPSNSGSSAGLLPAAAGPASAPLAPVAVQSSPASPESVWSDWSGSNEQSEPLDQFADQVATAWDAGLIEDKLFAKIK